MVTPSAWCSTADDSTLEKAPDQARRRGPDRTASQRDSDAALVDYLEFYLLNYFKPAPDTDRRSVAWPGALRRIGLHAHATFRI